MMQVDGDFTVPSIIQLYNGAPLGRGAKLQVAIHLQVVWGV